MQNYTETSSAIINSMKESFLLLLTKYLDLIWSHFYVFIEVDFSRTAIKYVLKMCFFVFITNIIYKVKEDFSQTFMRHKNSFMTLMSFDFVVLLRGSELQSDSL